MLFNSYTFIFFFLLPVLTLFFVLRPAYRLGFLILASLLFYGQWSWMHLGLLLFSILLNYLFSLLIKENQYQRTILTIAIVLNLLPLIYFKYSFFLQMSSQSLILPLAISFYTFQQIAFQIDHYRAKIKVESLAEYTFFVLFFPQLIAGPIVHYRQIISQVREGAFERVEWQTLQAGLVLFSLGLFKKVVLADQLFPLANGTFEHIETLHTLSAWLGLFAYTFGLYFDFSGYTDMAIGLGLFFGLRLPINFDSPYKAVDIVDFWRRWHITLSNFLRDYLYIPLGGNKGGELKEVFNLILTMTLGGIWHGAGWNFIFWGALHGTLIALVHLKNRHVNRWKIPRPVAIALTFVMVSLLWVLFRAPGIGAAWNYYHILFNFSSGSIAAIELFTVSIAMSIVWFLPNSMEFIGYPKLQRFGWRYALVAAVLCFAALKMMAEAPAQRFVYFDF